MRLLLDGVLDEWVSVECGFPPPSAPPLVAPAKPPPPHPPPPPPHTRASIVSHIERAPPLPLSVRQQPVPSPPAQLSPTPSFAPLLVGSALLFALGSALLLKPGNTVAH